MLNNSGKVGLQFGNSAYFLKRLVATSYGLPKPHNDSGSASVNPRHGLNLLPFFFLVFLVDADGIDPQNALKKTIPKMRQRRVQVCRDR